VQTRRSSEGIADDSVFMLASTALIINRRILKNFIKHSMSSLMDAPIYTS